MSVWNYLNSNTKPVSVKRDGLNDVEIAIIEALSQYGGSASSFQILGKVSHTLNDKSLKSDKIQKAVSSLEGKSMVVVIEKFGNGSAKKIVAK